VHAAGVKFDHAFFVGNSAEANRIVVGIVFRTFDHFDGGVERVSSGLQEGERVLEVGVAVVGADDDGALVRTRLRVAVLSGVRLGIVTLGARSYTGSDRSENGSLNEVTARECHFPPASMEVIKAFYHRVTETQRKPFWASVFFLVLVLSVSLW